MHEAGALLPIRKLSLNNRPEDARRGICFAPLRDYSLRLIRCSEYQYLDTEITKVAPATGTSDFH